ncbi:MAG: glutathione S-transferase family protein [Paraglaciecola sp.]|nr:glutathione S-transferase family protein [Paraglaciecola sp.]MDP5129518.1 glutathione S-transferase family protein [Paraglaciecola sp.]
MKIYETHTAPSPRRVRIFLAEKNIPMEYVQVDIAKGENLSAQMRAKNPMVKIPILELDDGTCISETHSICRYFEEVQPEPPLLGRSALEKAQIDMWQRFVELHLFMQVGMCFQHTTGYFKDRMNPINEYGVEAGKQAQSFLAVLEERLATHTYIAGDHFSVADITAVCAIDFARVVKIKVLDEQIHIKRWYALVNERPSMQA